MAGPDGRRRRAGSVGLQLLAVLARAQPRPARRRRIRMLVVGASVAAPASRRSGSCRPDPARTDLQSVLREGRQSGTRRPRARAAHDGAGGDRAAARCGRGIDVPHRRSAARDQSRIRLARGRHRRRRARRTALGEERGRARVSRRRVAAAGRGAGNRARRVCRPDSAEWQLRSARVSRRGPRGEQRGCAVGRVLPGLDRLLPGHARAVAARPPADGCGRRGQGAGRRHRRDGRRTDLPRGGSDRPAREHRRRQGPVLDDRVRIVGDVRHYGLDEPPNPQAYVSQRQFTNRRFWWCDRRSASSRRRRRSVARSRRLPRMCRSRASSRSTTACGRRSRPAGF